MSRSQEAAAVTATNLETVDDASSPEIVVLRDIPLELTETRPVESSQIASNGHLVRDYARPQSQDRARPTWLRKYTAWVVVADLVAALAAATIAINSFDTGVERQVALLFAPVWVAALALGRSYEHRFVGNGGEEYKRLFHAAVVFLAGFATVAYALAIEEIKYVVVVAIPLAMIFSLVNHWVARQGLHRARRRGACMQRVIVVGLERSVAEIIQTMRREPHAGLDVVAACIDRPRGDTVDGVPVLGNSDQVIDVLNEVGADTVAVTSWSDVTQNDLRHLSWDLEGTGVTLLVAPRLTDISGPRIHIRPVAGLPLLNIEEPEFGGVRRVIKGGLDRMLALMAVIVLSPLFIAIALAIKITSRGPVFFTQTRVGRHGRPFTMHKFRSMHVDAPDRQLEVAALNQSDGVLFKMRDDPRVTRLGRTLRRFSLDELPQFFDVVMGRMSLVGPRPPLPCEVESYPSQVRRRLVVKPGITGLWQVSGRSDLSWEESVRLDLLYVESWSLALDIAIMLKTMIAVIRQSGAY